MFLLYIKLPCLKRKSPFKKKKKKGYVFQEHSRTCFHFKRVIYLLTGITTGQKEGGGQGIRK